jgi:hypothetical protein
MAAVEVYELAGEVRLATRMPDEELAEIERQGSAAAIPRLVAHIRRLQAVLDGDVTHLVIRHEGRPIAAPAAKPGAASERGGDRPPAALAPGSAPAQPMPPTRAGTPPAAATDRSTLAALQVQAQAMRQLLRQLDALHDRLLHEHDEILGAHSELRTLELELGAMHAAMDEEAGTPARPDETVVHTSARCRPARSRSASRDDVGGPVAPPT